MKLDIVRGVNIRLGDTVSLTNGKAGLEILKVEVRSNNALSISRPNTNRQEWSEP